MLICFSRVQLFVTLWSITCQASLSMGFSRQEYWNGFPFAPPRDLPDPGIEPGSPAMQADSLLLSHRGSKLYLIVHIYTLRTFVIWNIQSAKISCFFFLSKNKRHSFQFLQELYWTMYKSQLHNIIFPKLFIFLSKELFQGPFIDFQGIDIFSVKRILQRPE